MKKTINFGNIKINNNNFYKTKELFKIDDIDANKILISKREPYGKNKVHSNTLLLMMVMIISVLYV